MKQGRNRIRARRVISFLLIMMVLCSFFNAYTVAGAEEKRTVKVAFFPMDGYHEKGNNGAYEGMDVEYLSVLADYADWEIEYVECNSWDDALLRLENKEVDLVGSAQYSAARAEKFQYADLSSGYTYGAIAVNKNSPLAYEDFDVMEEISFGIVKTYVRKGEFLDYLKSNGIESPKVIEFESTAELLAALENGNIDAMVHTLTEIREGLRLIGRFAPMPFYYISYYGNDELMMELNQAVADIKINHPELETSLMNKYYQSRFDATMLLTTEEQRYIEENPNITIGYIRDQYPFVYEKDGVLMGLSKRLVEDSLAVLGFIPEYRGYRNQEEAYHALQADEIQLMAYCGDQEKENLVVLKEYAEMPLVILMNKEDSLNEIHTLATIDCMIPELESLSIDFGTQVVCETQIACLEAMEEGIVNAVLCSGYLAQYLLSIEYQYSELEIKTVLNGSHSASVVMRKDGDMLLRQIAQKTIPIIDAKQINEYMLSENTFHTFSLKNFLYAHSMVIIMILLVLLMIIGAVASHMIRNSLKIQKLMYKDTGIDIWNTNYFFYKGQQRIAQEKKHKYAVVALNISQFRSYNVIYGWNAGDRLLAIVADVLLTKVSAGKEIRARHQGDRFVLLLTWDNWEQFRQRMEKLKKDIEQRIYTNTNSKLNIELGVCAIEQGSNDLHGALNRANQALDFVDKDSIAYFDDALDDLVRAKHEQETLLESVDVSRHFLAYYQPKVDIRTDKIIGAEALVRFADPSANGAIRAPGFFVPYYEQTGKITEIDFFVLESTCRMLRRRMDEGKPIVPVSCNFSRKNFLQSDFPDRFEQILQRYDISKEMIELEITETLVVEELQYSMVKKTLEVLKQRNVKISIDDFGAGYSSLGVFEQIPASVIKLDRSFLLNKENRERQVKIMRGIVKLGTELGARIVCEGVETQDDVQVMKEIGAYIAQGYFYSKPVPESDFEEKLNLN